MNHTEEIVDDGNDILAVELEAQNLVTVASSPNSGSKNDETDEILNDDNDNDDGSSPSFTYREHTLQILAITCAIILSEVFQNTLPIIDIGT